MNVLRFDFQILQQKTLHTGIQVQILNSNVTFLYYPVMLSHSSPAPVRTNQAVQIQ